MAFGNWVQGVSADGGSGTLASFSKAFGSNIGGSGTPSIVVTVRRGGTSGVVTVTDSLSNTYSLDEDTGEIAGLGRVLTFHASGDTGAFSTGACTVTAHTTVNQTLRFVQDEYQGTYRKNAGATASGSSTSPASGNFTTTQTCAIYGGIGGDNNQNPSTTAGTGFTKREELLANWKITTEDQASGQAAGTFNAGLTLTVSAGWGANGVGYQNAAAVTTPPLTFPPSHARLRTTPSRVFTGKPPPPTLAAPRPAVGNIYRARYLNPCARSYVSHTPPPTLPAPRSARQRDIVRARFLLPPDQLKIGKPPPPPIPAPRSAVPPQVLRSKFLLPSPKNYEGHPPPPTIPAPRPAPGNVYRSRYLNPPDHLLTGRTFPPLVVLTRPLRPTVTRALFLLPRPHLSIGFTPPPTVPAPRPAKSYMVVRARYLLPPDHFTRGFTPVPPIPAPRPAVPPQILRAHFLLPRSFLFRGLTPVPTVAPPPPPPRSVIRARLGPIPRSRVFIGITPRGITVVVTVFLSQEIRLK